MTSSATLPSIDGAVATRQLAPETAEDFARALHEADDAGLAVAPIGGGTQLDLGMPPRRVDVALQTGGLNRIVEYEPADLTVTVEAGIRFSELQTALGEHGQLLALDPPVEADATIGGVIATNVSGPLRFAFGSARDLVIGTRVANPDGSLTRAGGRVVKNVAGYDLNKLHIGGLGTLGVLVELSFKLAPIPPALGTVAGSFESLDSIGAAVGAVLHSPLSPLAVEVIGESKQLVFRIGGYEAAVERQARDLREVVVGHGGAPLDSFDWDDMVRQRRDAMRHDVVLKAAAPLAQSTALLTLLQSHLSTANPTTWAHAGNGIAYAACDVVPAEVLIELRTRVQALGSNASLVIQRCPTSLKREIDVWGDTGSSLGVMRAIKAKLDPKSTLNPGRYVGGI